MGINTDAAQRVYVAYFNGRANPSGQTSTMAAAVNNQSGLEKQL